MIATVVPSSQGENPNPTGEEMTNTTTQSEVIKVCTPYSEGIPEELKNIAQWVVWYNNTKDTPRGSKQPRHPSSPYAVSALDSCHWFDFSAAVDTYEKMGVSGVGFAFTKEVRMTTIDVDGCVDYNDDGEGIVNELGQSVLDKFADGTYAEISFHLDGIHIVTYGNLPDGEVGGHRVNAAGQQIEMYDCARFIAITGRKVSTCNAHVGHCEAVLADLCEEFKCVVKKKADRPKSTVPSRPSIGEELGLQCMSICPPYKSFVRGDEVVGCNPLSGHMNTSGTAYSVNPRKNTWYCWAHKCGGDALMLYAMEKGLISCGEQITDYHELYNELRADGYDLSFLDPTYDPHCGDDLMKTTNVDKPVAITNNVEKIRSQEVDIRLDCKLEETNFVSQYMRYREKRTDAYIEYFHSGAVSMLSIAADRKIKVPLSFGDIYTNIWSMCLGLSSVSRKSTQMKFVTPIVDVKFGDFALPHEFSPESMIEDMAKHVHSHLLLDECGTIITALNTRSYMAGFKETLCKLFDGTSVHRKLRTSKKLDSPSDFHVTDPYITFAWATTYDSFENAATESDVKSGLLARFLIYAPRYSKTILGAGIRTSSMKYDMDALQTRFNAITDKIQAFPGMMEFIPSEAAFKLYNEWDAGVQNDIFQNRVDTSSSIVHARMGTVVFKLASLYYIGSERFLTDIDKSAIVTPEPELLNPHPVGVATLLIPDEYMIEALNNVRDYFAPCASSILDSVSEKGSTNVQVKMCRIIKDKGGNITKTSLLRDMKMKVKEFDEHLSAMRLSGQIEMVVTPNPEHADDRKYDTSVIYLLQQ
jgi:hypothetical protein